MRKTRRAASGPPTMMAGHRRPNEFSSLGSDYLVEVLGKLSDDEKLSINVKYNARKHEMISQILNVFHVAFIHM